MLNSNEFQKIWRLKNKVLININKNKKILIHNFMIKKKVFSK